MTIGEVVSPAVSIKPLSDRTSKAILKTSESAIGAKIINIHMYGESLWAWLNNRILPAMPKAVKCSRNSPFENIIGIAQGYVEGNTERALPSGRQRRSLTPKKKYLVSGTSRHRAQ